MRISTESASIGGTTTVMVVDGTAADRDLLAIGRPPPAPTSNTRPAAGGAPRAQECVLTVLPPDGEHDPRSGASGTDGA